ncbi:hypothetical protein GN956_G7790 [Arapaima gigas]
MSSAWSYRITREKVATAQALISHRAGVPETTISQQIPRKWTASRRNQKVQAEVLGVRLMFWSLTLQKGEESISVCQNKGGAERVAWAAPIQGRLCVIEVGGETIRVFGSHQRPGKRWPATAGRQQYRPPLPVASSRRGAPGPPLARQHYEGAVSSHRLTRRGSVMCSSCRSWPGQLGGIGTVDPRLRGLH